MEHYSNLYHKLNTFKVTKKGKKEYCSIYDIIRQADGQKISVFRKTSVKTEATERLKSFIGVCGTPR